MSGYEYLSIDPLEFRENPMSFNRYAYVNGNPNKYNDPDGRDPVFNAIETDAVHSSPQAMKMLAVGSAVGVGIMAAPFAPAAIAACSGG